MSCSLVLARRLGLVLATVGLVLGAWCVFPASAETEITNVALGKPTKASSERGQYVGALAVDGIRDTTASRWLTSELAERPHWLEIDLLGPHVIVGAEVWTGHQPGGNSLYVVTRFKLQYWDGEDWIDIPGGSVENNREEGVGLTFTESVVTDRVRFVTDRPDWQYNIVRVREIVILGYPFEEAE